MVEGGMKCVKYILFAFNLIFFLAGLGLIIAGAVVQTKFATYFDFFGGSISAAARLLIVVGVIIFIIGFFGCCGAYKENYCMTMTFAILLGLIFILEIAAGITAHVMRNQVKDLVENNMTESMKNFNSSEGVARAWDSVQHDFNCCGVKQPSDWDKYMAGVPDSCCKTDTKDCGKSPHTDIFTRGCVDGFVLWVKSNIYNVGGVCIGVAFIQAGLSAVTILIWPPNAIITMPVVTLKYVELHCQQDQIGLLVPLSYNLLLMTLCSILAFITRKLPDNFNESWYIFLSVSTTLFIWFAFLPTYYAAFFAQHKAALLALAMSLNGSVIALCLFGPKIYALYFIDDSAIKVTNFNSASFEKPQSTEV